MYYIEYSLYILKLVNLYMFYIIVPANVMLNIIKAKMDEPTCSMNLSASEATVMYC